MGVVVGKDVYPLAPHLLDQLCQRHGPVLIPLDGRLIAARKLDQGHRTLAYLELGLDRGGAQRYYGLILAHRPKEEDEEETFFRSTQNIMGRVL